MRVNEHEIWKDDEGRYKYHVQTDRHTDIHTPNIQRVITEVIFYLESLVLPRTIKLFQKNKKRLIIMDQP